MSHIIVVGSLNMDLVVTAPRIPALGETILGSGFMTAPGGKGANQAVAAARLGGRVALVGCVGQDSFGENLLANLAANRVDLRKVRRIGGESTGIAMIVVKDGDNLIIVDPGANSSLTPELIEATEDMIRESSIMVIQLEIPITTVERAISLAQRHRVRILLNPAPARTLGEDILSRVDIITPNETEAAIMTGLAVTDIESAKQALAILRGKGIGQVVITLGDKGALYNKGDQIKHQPVPPVQAIDTTAAGDSFTGALAVALAEGKGIDEAVEFANIVGALTVTKRGAQVSLPDQNDVVNYRKLPGAKANRQVSLSGN